MRPKPRIAVVGASSDSLTHQLEGFFPTVYHVSTFEELRETVDPAELDLVVLLNGPVGPGEDFTDCISTISFCPYYSSFRITKQVHLKLGTLCPFHDFSKPRLPMRLHTCREVEYADLETVRNYRSITVEIDVGEVSRIFSPGCDIMKELAPIERKFKDALTEGSILMSNEERISLGGILVREDRTGLACLPNVVSGFADWILVLAEQWKEEGVVGLEEYPDWRLSYMTSAEEKVQLMLEKHDREVRQFEESAAIRRKELELELVEESSRADRGARRLLTEQSDELVDAVSHALAVLGFRVVKLDEEFRETEQNLEDLRISYGAGDSEVHAIAEVKGYRKSPGKLEAIAKIERFSAKYMSHLGCEPDLKILVLNGPIELPPSARPKPFACEAEAMKEFGEADGVVISSVDLFKLVKLVENGYPAEVLAMSILEARGVYSPPESMLMED